MKKMMIKTVILVSSFIATQAYASLVYNSFGSGTTNPNFGGYSLTDFEIGSYNEIDDHLLVNSPISGGGQVSFDTKPYANSDEDLITHTLDTLSESSAYYTDGNGKKVDWWDNKEGFDFDTYTTTNHWIKIILPENTLAFSFNIAANTGAGGWFTAEDSNGYGLTNAGSNGRASFSVSPTNSPGFGIYADNSQATADNCSYVSSVIVDPSLYWGVGNFSIAQGNCSATVPEPSIIALMSFGIIGLGFARRKMK